MRKIWKLTQNGKARIPKKPRIFVMNKAKIPALIIAIRVYVEIRSIW